MLFWSVLGASIASALVPLINIEVYLVGLAAVRDSTGIWLLATIAGIGQMVGKVVWYYLGANALKWPWIAKRVDTPKGRATLEKWRARTNDRPVLGATLLFASAVSGFVTEARGNARSTGPCAASTPDGPTRAAAACGTGHASIAASAASLIAADGRGRRR